MNPYYDGAVQFTLFLQSLGDWMAPILNIFSFMGREEFYVFFLVFVWSLDYKLSLRLGVMLTLTTWSNNFLKMSLGQPRPFWYSSEVQGLSHAETSFGIPSGHSQTPASLYGLLAASLNKKWAKALIWIVIFLIGYSRIHLGMHFYGDVLLGWALGFLALWLFLRYEKPVMDFFNTKSYKAKIWIVFAFSLVMVLASLGLITANWDYQIPAAWAQNALAAYPEDPPDPYSLENALTTAGTFFGLTFGALWLTKEKTYRHLGGWGKWAGIFFLGLIGALAIKEGLGALFRMAPDSLLIHLRYIRYTLIGFWVAGWAPKLYLKLGWGTTEE